MADHDRDFPSEEEFNAELRSELQRLQRKYKYTHEEVARRLGITAFNYEKYRNRVTSAVPPYLIPRICDLYHISPTDLLPGFLAGPFPPPGRKRAPAPPSLRRVK